MKLQNAMGQMDDDLITAADGEKIVRRNLPIQKWIAAAACFAVIIGVGMPLMSGMQRRVQSSVTDDAATTPGLTDIPSDTVTDSETDAPLVKPYIEKKMPSDGKKEQATILEKHWDEKPDAERYGTLTYRGKEYGTRVSCISAEAVGEALGEVKVQGFDTYTDTEHCQYGQAYAIGRVNPSVALCYRFEDSDEYCVYVDNTYCPETLGDMISDLDLKNTLRIGNVVQETDSMTCVYYEDVSADTLWQMLLSDETAANQPDANPGKMIMSVRLRADALGYHDVGLGLTDTGWIWTSLVGYVKYFYIGTDAVNAFVKEVTEKHQGYIYVYEPSDADIVEE